MHCGLWVDAGIINFGAWEKVRQRLFDLAYFFLRPKAYRETTSEGLVETWEKVRLSGVLWAGNAGIWHTKMQAFTASGKSTPEYAKIKDSA